MERNTNETGKPRRGDMCRVLETLFHANMRSATNGVHVVPTGLWGSDKDVSSQADACGYNLPPLRGYCPGEMCCRCYAAIAPA